MAAACLRSAAIAASSTANPQTPIASWYSDPMNCEKNSHPLMRIAHVVVPIALLIGQSAKGAEYTGYLTVNDEDYGYWQGRLTVVVAGARQPLDTVLGSTVESIEFELSHDLGQGLVRQFVPRSRTTRGVAAAGVAEASDMAGGATPAETVVGNSGWARFGSFQTFGFGQYEGSDVAASVYCDRNPSVWVWAAGGSIEAASPDAAANRVTKGENGMARLRLSCERAMEVSK